MSALTPFRINTSGSVDSKAFYPPLKSTLMKNRGGQLLLTRNPKKDFYPEEHRDEGSLLLFVAQPFLTVLFRQSPVTILFPPLTFPVNSSQMVLPKETVSLD